VIESRAFATDARTVWHAQQDRHTLSVLLSVCVGVSRSIGVHTTAIL